MRPNRRAGLALLVAAALGLAACGSNKDAKKEDDTVNLSTRPKMTTTREGDYLVQHFDLDGKGKYDVLKYIETYQDPDNPDVTKRRIRKKKVDLDTDGDFDVLREYDKEGVIQREEVDIDLDDTPDVINHFEAGSLVRKEILADDGETTVATREYSGGEITKVSKDKNGDGRMDHWEYYKDGKLQRIGRDLNGDEEIDKWVHR